MQDVAKNYSEALKGAEQHIEFKSSEVELDIPLEGITSKEGWNVVPLTEPIVSCPIACKQLIYMYPCSHVQGV